MHWWAGRHRNLWAVETVGRLRCEELTDDCESSAGAARGAVAATSIAGSAGTMSSVMPSNMPGFLPPHWLRDVRVVGRRRGAVALCRMLFLTLGEEKSKGR